MMKKSLNMMVMVGCIKKLAAEQKKYCTINITKTQKQMEANFTRKLPQIYPDDVGEKANFVFSVIPFE